MKVYFSNKDKVAHDDVALSLRYKLLDQLGQKMKSQNINEQYPETSTKGYSYPPPPPNVPRLSYENGKAETIYPEKKKLPDLAEQYRQSNKGPSPRPQQHQYQAHADPINHYQGLRHKTSHSYYY